MATASKKKPSAAETARREAQSKKDSGKPTPTEVTVMGVTLTVDPEEVDDFDAMVSMEGGDYRPMLACIAPDEEERTRILDALRTETGKLRYSRVVEFVNGIFEAVGKGN